MKIHKKIILVVAIATMALVLAISAFAVASTFNGDSVDHNEVYYGVQVSTTGNVNLKFFYTDLGSAEAMVAEVIDPSGNEIASYEFAKDEIAVKSGKYCITVPLAPSQMTCTVKVYAKSSAGVGEAIEYSVRQYAEDVLANAGFASYHSTMRALLNWGAMAQETFDESTDAIANDGIYSRDTNPIDGLASIPFNNGAVNSSEHITGYKYSVSIEPDNTVMNLYVTYTGEGTLSATVSKNNGEAKETSVIETNIENVYLVRISNLGVAVYDAAYTVTVTDESETFTATKSVLEYLNTLAFTTDENLVKYNDVAKAMYQFYTAARKSVSFENCKHTATHWLAVDENTSLVECSGCFTVFGGAIGNNVERFHPAEAIVNKGSNHAESLDRTLGKDEDGTAYVRLDNFVNKGGWGGWNLFSDANASVSGRYMIMKVRVGVNGLGQTYLTMYTSTQKASLNNNDQKCAVKVSEDNEWHIVVVDLAARTGQNKDGVWQTEFTENNGTYTTTFLQIRPFSNAQTTNEADDYMDIAYIAYCDDLDDINDVVKEEKYEWSTGNTSCAVRYVATNYCVTHPGEKVEESATAIIYSCTACAAEFDRESYPESTNKYLGSNYINNRPSGGTHRITSSGRLNENGTVYYRFNGQNQTGQIFWTRMGYDGSGKQWADYQLNPFNVGKAKYVVVKMRGNNDISSVRFNVGTIVGEASYDNYDNMKVGGVNIPQNALNGTDWTYFVVDIAKAMPGAWNANSGGTYDVCYLQFTFNGETFTTDTYFDISYIAFVDDWSEVSALTGQNTVDFIYKSGLNAKINTASGECAGNHVVKETITGNVYKYTCLACDKVLAEKTVSTDVNWYASISGMTNWSTNCIKSLGYDPVANIVYASYNVTGSTHINITGGDGSGAETTDSYSTGRYFVMMYRGSMPGNTMRMKISSTGTVQKTYNGGERVGTKLPSGWTIEVLDLSLMTDYTCDSTGQIYIMFNPQSAGQIDVAYAAIVDNFDEVASLVGEGNKYVYCGTSFKNTGMVCTTGYDPSDYRLDATEIEIAQKSNRAVNIGSVELRNDGAFDYVRTKGLADGTEPYWSASYQYATGTSGKYLIFKYRTNVKTGWLELYSSTQTNSAIGDDITWTTLNGDEKWHVFIVDMEKTVQKGDTFVADGNGNFSAGYIRFDLFYESLKSADVYFDMAYVDWAETIDEAFAKVEGEDIKYGYYASKWVDAIRVTDAYDIEASEFADSAQASAQMAGTVTYNAATESDVAFVRTTANASAERGTWWVHDYPEISGSSGAYMIIKYRTNAGGGWMHVFTSTQTENTLNGSTQSTEATWIAPVSDEKWHVVIIDFNQTVFDSGSGGFAANSKGEFTPKFVGFQFHQYGAITSSSYTDIAYVCWADSIDVALNKIGEGEDIAFGYYKGGKWNSIQLPQ